MARIQDPSSGKTSAPKVCFPAALAMGRNILIPGHPGVNVRSVRGTIGPGLVAQAIRNTIRANHSKSKPPIFIACQADSHESLEFPIHANHPIRANRANRFARIKPLRSGVSVGKSDREICVMLFFLP